MISDLQPRIEVPQRKVVRLTYDPTQDTAVITWSDGTTEEVLVLEFVYGPQGTWARLTPVNDPTYVICVTQSANMPSGTYIVYEPPYIPDEPVILTPEAQPETAPTQGEAQPIEAVM